MRRTAGAARYTQHTATLHMAAHGRGLASTEGGCGRIGSLLCAETSNLLTQMEQRQKDFFHVMKTSMARQQASADCNWLGTHTGVDAVALATELVALYLKGPDAVKACLPTAMPACAVHCAWVARALYGGGRRGGCCAGGQRLPERLKAGGELLGRGQQALLVGHSFVCVCR